MKNGMVELLHIGKYEERMKALLQKTLICSLFLASLVVSAQTVHAQASSLQISPAIIEDRAEPGQVFNFSVRVTNQTDSEATYYLLARDILGTNENGAPIFAEEDTATQYELSSWIALPQDFVTLKAGESKTVPFTVTVPRDATPGAHFGGVFFEQRAVQVTETGAGVASRVGPIINLRIAGDVTEDMRLREFSTAKFIYQAPPVDFTINAENLGNVLLRPHGGIEISDMFGKKVGTIEVNPSAGAVFPGGIRTYEVQWATDGFVFGRYEALASMVYGEDGRKTVTRSASFWVLPLKPLLIVIGVALAVLLGLYIMMRVYIQRKLRAMGVTDATGAARRYQNPVSRVTFVSFGLLIVCVALLVLLFSVFA